MDEIDLRSIFGKDKFCTVNVLLRAFEEKLSFGAQKCRTRREVKCLNC
jgi:hypothetical protein